MAESTKKRGGRSDPRTAEAEEMVEVTLRRSVGRRGGPFYGPGVTMVPASLARSLELSPDLVETDPAGNPQPHTVAASVFGATTSATAERDAHPIPARDPDTGDVVEADDKGQPVSETARRAAAIADNAEKGPDRQGGKLAGESGSLTDTKRAVHPLPGQTDASREQSAQLAADAERDKSGGGEGAGESRGAGRSAGGRSGAGRIPGVEGDKALSKSELRAQDEDVLIDLARRNKVSVPKKGGKKALVDKLYEARVTLD